MADEQRRSSAAVVTREVNGPLTVEQIQLKAPGPGEVRVRIHAAAVNFPDVLIVANQYQMQVDPPFVPGSEFAGVVGEVGSGVPGLAEGDRCEQSARRVFGERSNSDVESRGQREIGEDGK